MKTRALLYSLSLLPLLTFAQEGAKTLAVDRVQATPSVRESVRAAGKENTLSRIVQATDGQLMDRLHNTRRFDLFARSELDRIEAEQERAERGTLDPNDPNTARSFSMAGVQYIVTTTIDDFQDHTETATFEAIGRTATRRVLRLSAVTRMYDSTTGRLLESANFQISDRDVREEPAYQSISTGDLSDEMIVLLSRKMSQKVADRVLDVLYPARVVGKTGQVITLNRGDGTDIETGEEWIIYALGEEMIDPDTGRSLGQEEIEIGKIRITQVLPQVSRGVAIEDFGIERNQIARRAP